MFIFFISENKGKLVFINNLKENKIISKVYSTRLKNHYLIVSNLVGKIVHFPEQNINKRYFVEENSKLFIVSFLGNEYSYTLEFDIYLAAVYVKQNQIVDYSIPLFLIEKIL